MHKAITGIHTVTLCLDGYEHTAKLLTETMQLRKVGEEGNCFRYAAGAGGSGAMVDLRCAPDACPGIVAGGTIHHVAWRTMRMTNNGRGAKRSRVSD